ncbi:carbohydrate ABC transporter permease [Geochorda subterranea]|uniref:Carbohydrate ABC transporter permease n=1 Tax=Geochorda subterranea TaxID=3109564 RepID=A0ABZ1BM42_9FIRM|nr:carbohydrate ABC transporter permease [Limnochorda sp. LNt]WRP13804.1 carbohydrate ABC transporter permease [Limnochorda sp. LNt]
MGKLGAAGKAGAVGKPGAMRGLAAVGRLRAAGRPRAIGRLRAKTEGIIVASDYRLARHRLLYVLLFGGLAMAAVVALFPVVWLALSSFKGPVELYRTPLTLLPDQVDLRKAAQVWQTLAFGRYYLNSLWVVAGAVASAVLVNGLLAYGVSVLRPAGHKLVTALMMGSLMIPPILNMGPLFRQIVALGLIDSYIPLWLVFGANPFYFLIMTTYFDRLPRALFEAARIDGCNGLQMFWKVAVPLSRPILAVVAIFAANAAWSDFLLPFLVLRSDALQTVMVKIYTLQAASATMQGFGPDKLLMVLVLASLPPVALFVLFQRRITSTVATTGLKE